MNLRLKQAFVVCGLPENAASALCCALLSLALLSSGCAGYRLGPTNGVAAGEKINSNHSLRESNHGASARRCRDHPGAETIAAGWDISIGDARGRRHSG